MVGLEFNPLHDYIILPQFSCIITQCQGIEIVDECISDSIVRKIIPGMSDYFFAQVAAKARDFLNHFRGAIIRGSYQTPAYRLAEIL